MFRDITISIVESTFQSHDSIDFTIMGLFIHFRVMETHLKIFSVHSVHSASGDIFGVITRPWRRCWRQLIFAEALDEHTALKPASFHRARYFLRFESMIITRKLY